MKSAYFMTFSGVVVNLMLGSLSTSTNLVLREAAFARGREQHGRGRGLVGHDDGIGFLQRLQHGRIDQRIVVPELCRGRHHRERGRPSHDLVRRHDGANTRILALALMERRRGEVRADRADPDSSATTPSGCVIVTVYLSKRPAPRRRTSPSRTSA